MYRIDITYNHSSYLGSAATLNNAVEHAQRMRSYYDGSAPDTECRYTDVRVGFYEDCAKCGGVGRIVARRFKRSPPKYKDCAHCKSEGRFPLPLVG